MEIVQDTRPPYIEFKRIAVEDRQATIEAGHRVTRNEDMAFIMQPGSRDIVEKIASDWLAQITKLSDNNMYPKEWVKHFKSMYQDWLDGKEADHDGTSLREWPPISPAEVENLARIKCFTVEDLAVLNDDAIRLGGMGTRILKDKAVKWLEASNDAGKLTERITALEAENANKDETIRSLEAKIEKLEADKPKRGRPKAA